MKAPRREMLVVWLLAVAVGCNPLPEGYGDDCDPMDELACPEDMVCQGVSSFECTIACETDDDCPPGHCGLFGTGGSAFPCFDGFCSTLPVCR